MQLQISNIESIDDCTCVVFFLEAAQSEVDIEWLAPQPQASAAKASGAFVVLDLGSLTAAPGWSHA